MKTLVLGLGNPILSDDSVGIQVAEALEKELSRQDVTVTTACAGGVYLLDLLEGYDRAILVDAVQTKDGRPGQVYRLEPDAFEKARHVSTTHGLDFATAIEVGKQLGMVLPAEICIYAIEAADVSTFGEECTSDVKQAITVAVANVIREL